MPFPTIGRPLPRAVEAHATEDKWRNWILATRGHGDEWARVFDVGPDDGERIWKAIAAAIFDAPVAAVRNRAPHGIVSGVELTLTVNDRTAQVATAWHYAAEDAAPRLVTAYPTT